MTGESFEALAVPVLVLAIAAWCLSGCAPDTFTKDGVIFRPVPRSVIVLLAPAGIEYRPDAVALRAAHPPTVLYADDSLMFPALETHELKHFRRDPDSPTGYCEHLPDGVTWIHDVCQK